ncbi:hypothetical protein [Streptacidiphilus rugosus]|uniref:hypothetical protein n=1 Tax=Streptacidiphilus rugosus TaxID=405783 RepID=UPI00055DE695|nr:hypothetical protein [Streptacidiphilus rugosus]
MSITTALTKPAFISFGKKDQPSDAAASLAGVKPLSPWFFVFEGLMGAAYDIIKLHPDAWMALSGLGLVNMLVGLTVLGKRRKLVRAMLKNGRSRTILGALIGLRIGVHLILGLLGTQVTSTAGHLGMAAFMTATTVGLMWFDQRVTFRTLGLPLTPVEAV